MSFLFSAWSVNPLLGSFTRNTNNIGHWCEKAEQVASEFTTLMGKSPFHFVDRLYHCYIVTRKNNTFRDAIITIALLQKSIRQCQDGILQLSGIGKLWTQCEEVGKCVSDVLKALEDVLCYGMAGLEDLIECHSRRELLYQTLPLT